MIVPWGCDGWSEVARWRRVPLAGGSCWVVGVGEVLVSRGLGVPGAGDPVGEQTGPGRVPGRCRRRCRPWWASRPAMREQPEPESFGFPAAGVVPVRASICIQARSSQARATISHQIWFWVEVVQRQVAQAGVLGVADPVLAAGPAAVTQFEVGELPAGGVGGERGEPVPVDVGEAQLGAGVRAFLADDHPHPGRPGRSGRAGR